MGTWRTGNEELEFGANVVGTTTQKYVQQEERKIIDHHDVLEQREEGWIGGLTVWAGPRTVLRDRNGSESGMALARNLVEENGL